MIQDNLVTQLSQMIKAVEPPLLQTAEISVDLPQWQVGQKLPAVVVASLPNGRFQVQVQNQLLDMNLPKNTQPGMHFDLVFVSNTPRPTFLLQLSTLETFSQASLSQQDQSPPSSAQSGNTSQVQNLATPRPGQIASPVNPQAENLNIPFKPIGPTQTYPLATLASQPASTLSSQTTTISETAQSLVALIRNLQEATVPKLKPQPALLSEPTHEAAPIASALSQAIGRSGLFYEAHLAKWVEGKLSLTDLQQEPQAQLKLTPFQASSANLLTSSSTHILDQGLSYVQAQMNLLNSGIVAYQSELWPRQKIELHIYGHSAEQSKEGQSWQTLVDITLPRIGKVRAWLVYHGGAVSIHCEAAGSSTRDELTASEKLLSLQMESAGLKLNKLTVKTYGE
ncbi:MAG TPA: flagellar hook-length control protein FliK [Burkholderiales bacterium]|nr:flagellar hook-length control protein FliK [Burkholderiales bacterium]